MLAVQLTCTPLEPGSAICRIFHASQLSAVPMRAAPLLTCAACTTRHGRCCTLLVSVCLSACTAACWPGLGYLHDAPAS